MSDQIIAQVVSHHALPGPAGLAGVAPTAGEFVALRVTAGAGAGVARSGLKQTSALLSDRDLTGSQVVGRVETVVAEVVHDVAGGVVLASLVTSLV